MPTLLQQLGRSYYAECGSGSDCDAQTPTNHPAQQQSQQQQQQREREQQRDQRRDRDREREREHLHQLQSITNLLLDLPSASSSGPYLPSRAREGSCQRTPGGSITDGDMSISDLFGLGLPRGSLMGGSSGGAGGNGGGSGQTAIGSPGGYRNHHQYHSNTPSLSNHPTHHLHQYDDGYGYPATSTSVDTPGSPNSVTTPGSPGTPGSTYFNPYTFVPTVSSGTQSTPSPSGRNMQLQLIGSPTSPIHSPYYGRAILGSPSYSDSGSPTPDYNPMMGCSGSRSNSPADSETSGISSMDESMSDIMYCLTLNSGSHPRHPENVGSLMSPEADLLSSSGRTASFQRMTNKKYLPQQQSVHQHSHNHIRNHQYAPNQTKNYLSSFWDFEKNQTAPNQNRNYLGSFWESEKKNSCSGINSHVMSVNPSLPNTSEQQTSLDRAARFHRNAASLYDATCTWSGLLPQRTQDPLGYSSKVFLGGVPWDITESLLISTFKQFGQIRIEWPGKEPSATQPKGYVYIIFESEKQVKALLASCTHDFTNGGSWYYKISSKRTKGKEVEVIPWVLNDSNYVKSSSQKLDPQKTVFVGALHGMLTAKGLAKIMNDLFEEVIYAGIDTDKYKYPIGSARVTFSSTRSYFKAITAAFIEIKTAKFTKKVQVEPYLEDSLCSSCFVQQGPYFCRELVCFRYFCRSCWQWQHAMESMRHHKPRMRSTKTHRVVGLSSGAVLNNVGSRTSNILTI